MILRGNVTDEELTGPVRVSRPPGAPSANPAIADKAKKEQSRGQRAHDLDREGGRTGCELADACRHGRVDTWGRAARQGEAL